MQVSQVTTAMVNMDDLIEKAMTGDERSFNQLVSLWYKRIYNYVLKQCSVEELASDITQRTFISVFRNLAKLKDITRFKPWIYRIATNYCHEEGRKWSRSRTVPFTTSQGDDGETMIREEGQAEGAFYNPEMSYRQQEMQRILFASLQKISEDQRSVIIMKEYEGMKFREIAEVMDTSENTVKTWMYRGLKLLKNYLEEERITKETLSYEL
ncbi:RNA polymerase sigma-70 factor, ECF subfamily [Ekhidna lutea]|uniref:RNA polymerase sigma-70 factor, ECF subfamily n=1 Tax=Ekhidna lutea TaxID=447679 RepID=A0A239M4E8_EKHLU|nr:RNA polymerase sigma factor [Ekhidna lutea]SNT36844.1 RNA polymerase sigma-70 factor, ECF subfamily [Ekhidna lutea]